VCSKNSVHIHRAIWGGNISQTKAERERTKNEYIFGFTIN